MAKILIADDDPGMLMVLTETFKDQQHEVVTANSAERAWELVRGQKPDLVLADVEMPTGRPSGLELLRNVKGFNESIPVIMITGEKTMDYAVTALRDRAYDFIRKPFKVDELINRVNNGLLQQKAIHAIEENAELKTQLRERFRFDSIVGKSQRMEAVFRMIERVANTDSTVLVLGESGTGKELVAKALHYNSRRAAYPFVAVNCAALPEHLLESELFGHRKGAFTGAAFDKVGLFQHAEGGTIFLDEVGSMALGLQSKLLRFLQDKEVRRVGDTEMIPVDVRVVAATNEPLQARLKDKSFREDLYYRISVIPIQLPPLRDRVDDIPLLIAHFVESLSQRMGRPVPHVPEEVLEVLRVYKWPGNVRELLNAIERACALCDNGSISLKDLPERLLENVAQQTAAEGMLGTAEESVAKKVAGVACWAHGATPIPLKEFLHQQEVVYIEHAIEAAEGDKERAAELLGISIATLYRKLTNDAGPVLNQS
jgi:DNA-binding NtrC family response regulator